MKYLVTRLHHFSLKETERVKVLSLEKCSVIGKMNVYSAKYSLFSLPIYWHHVSFENNVVAFKHLNILPTVFSNTLATDMSHDHESASQITFSKCFATLGNTFYKY